MSAALLLLLAPFATAAPPIPFWEIQKPATSARLRGVCAVDPRVVWASGTGGTFLKTADAGASWQSGTVPGAEALDFRDVEALNERTALLLSSGPGDQSRIYRTVDGGESWKLQFTNPDPEGFLDALAFWDRDLGIAFGDPVDGRFRVFLTEDGGTSWRPSPPDGMPRALAGEGAFAASGTCLVALPGTRTAWFGTGGAEVSRVFRSEDGGKHWATAETPVRSGNATSGIFSLAFLSPREGLAIGGDYKAPDRVGQGMARTVDGGATWSAVEAGPRGYRSAIVTLPGEPGKVIAVGPGGGEYSVNSGRDWSLISEEGFHALSARGEVWAVGDGGKVGRLVWKPARSD